jgi:hypothetical protein
VLTFQPRRRVEVAFTGDIEYNHFRAMLLSFRGAERQAPSILQMALRLVSIYETKKDTEFVGRGIDEAIGAIADRYNLQSAKGISKWQIDDDGKRSIINLATGTSPATRSLMQGHLNYRKWSDAAFNSEHLKSKRWLLGSRPKFGQSAADRKWESLLTVTAEAQELFLQFVITDYEQKGAKVKRATLRSRMRATSQEWDRYVDYSCLVTALIAKAREISSTTEETISKIHRSFMDRPGRGHAHSGPSVEFYGWSHLA